MKGAFLNYYDEVGTPKNISDVNNPESLTHRFVYDGKYPLYIWVQREGGLNTKSYLVYVNHLNGKLQAKLERVDSVSYSLNTDFHFKVFSSSGTVPNKYNGKLPYALFKKMGNR